MSFILAPLYPVAIYDHWAHATFELHRTPLAPTFTNLYFMILLSIHLHLFIFCIIIYEVDIFSLLDLCARSMISLRNIIVCPKLSIFYQNLLSRYLISNHINYRRMQLALDTLMRFLRSTSVPQILYIWLQLFYN